MCGFFQSKTDNLDWKRHRGATPSGSTGPSVDHTTGTRQGTRCFQK